MIRLAITRLRTLFGVAVLTLALVASIMGTTEPAAARSNLEGLCEATGGRYYEDWRIVRTNDGWSFGHSSSCIFPDGGAAFCDDGGCQYIPPD